MFEYFKYQELKDYSEGDAKRVIEETKKLAYQAPLFWFFSVLIVFFAIGLGVCLMQLPRVMAIERTVPGILIHGASILIAVTLHHWLAKVHFKRYLHRQLQQRRDQP